MMKLSCGQSRAALGTSVGAPNTQGRGNGDGGVNLVRHFRPPEGDELTPARTVPPLHQLRSPRLPRTKFPMRSALLRHAASGPDNGTDRCVAPNCIAETPSDSKPLHSRPSHEVWSSSPVCPTAKMSIRSGPAL